MALITRNVNISGPTMMIREEGPATNFGVDGLVYPLGQDGVAYTRLRKDVSSSWFQKSTAYMLYQMVDTKGDFSINIQVQYKRPGGAWQSVQGFWSIWINTADGNAKQCTGRMAISHWPIPSDAMFRVTAWTATAFGFQSKGFIGMEVA